jgi:hypothetical protein
MRRKIQFHNFHSISWFVFGRSKVTPIAKKFLRKVKHRFQQVHLSGVFHRFPYADIAHRAIMVTPLRAQRSGRRFQSRGLLSQVTTRKEDDEGD